MFSIVSILDNSIKYHTIKSTYSSFSFLHFFRYPGKYYTIEKKLFYTLFTAQAVHTIQSREIVPRGKLNLSLVDEI